MIFRSLNFFTFSSPGYYSFPQSYKKKRKPKIFGFKNVMGRGITTILTFYVIRLKVSKIWGKIILKPLKFRTDSRSPRMTEQIQTLQLLLECISRDLTVVSIAKKVFSMHQRRKPLLGTPDQKSRLI